MRSKSGWCLTTIAFLIILEIIVYGLGFSFKLLAILFANVLHLVPKVFLRSGKHTVSIQGVMAACRRLLSIKEV